MTILHPAEIRDMTAQERAMELQELETELLNARAVQAAGGAPENPGRIGELRRTIARIKTIQNEEGDEPQDVSPDVAAAVPGAEETAAEDDADEEPED